MSHMRRDIILKIAKTSVWNSEKISVDEGNHYITYFLDRW